MIDLGLIEEVDQIAAKLDDDAKWLCLVLPFPSHYIHF